MKTERIYTAYSDVAFYQDVCPHTGETIAESPPLYRGTADYEAVRARPDCVILDHKRGDVRGLDYLINGVDEEPTP